MKFKRNMREVKSTHEQCWTSYLKIVITDYTLLIVKVITLLYSLLSSKTNALHYLLLYFRYSVVSSVKVAFKQLKNLHNLEVLTDFQQPV